MEEVKGFIKKAFPYVNDKMNLPVGNVETAIPFYTKIMGFDLVSKKESPYQSAILRRDDIEMGLAENGGDPTQEGCFFEVENLEKAFAELKSRGLQKEISDFDVQKHGNTNWKVFFVVAPDGLCYCYGEKMDN